MAAFAHSYKTSTGNFKTIGMAERLRRLWSTDPILLAITIGIVALIAMFCLIAMAEVATLFGADAIGDVLRDAGQQVGGAGGLGAAGAAAAWAFERVRRQFAYAVARYQRETGMARARAAVLAANLDGTLVNWQQWWRETAKPSKASV